MVKTRRPLGSLASERNVGGEEILRRRVGPEQSPVQRQMNGIYERREEVWRPLTRQSIVAFIRLFLMCFVEMENGLPLEPGSYRMMKKCLVKRIIPAIHWRLVYTMDEAYWPITLTQFRELDSFLTEHLPIVQKEDEWATVAYFFKEVVRQREEYKRLEEMEREAKEAVQRCLNT